MRILLAFGLLLYSGSVLAQQQPADTVQLASGVRYVVHEKGAGVVPKAGNTVWVHYTGFLPSGKMFESSAVAGRPVKTRLGEHDVIPGWEEVLALLPAGSRVWVYIPAALGYGPKGVPLPDEEPGFLIPPDTDLRFELNVVKVK